MSWKVVAGHFYASESSKATGPFCSQTLEMVISGVDADVALDLDNASGTFWTAANADGTYGAVAKAVYAALQKIQMSAASLHSWGGNFSLYRPRGATASASTGMFTANYNSTNKTPNFTFDTANGPCGTNIILTWGMKPGFQPMTLDITP